MAKKTLNHKYLLSLYSKVNDFLNNDRISQEDLPEVIVSFCVVIEKILKIKLHNKNPLLIFETSYMKDDDNLSIIALKKENSIETARIQTIINRFKIVFKKEFTSEELQAILDIYKVRNNFIHGYKPDDKISFNSDDIIKKMGTVWEKISKIAISLFGKENIKNGKPKNKYTEIELEKALEEEVRKMIKPLNTFGFNTLLVQPAYSTITTPMHYFTDEKCPRCGYYSFSLDNQNSLIVALPDEGSDLYKCKNCHLELTKKQYEIAKKLLNTAK